MEHARAVELHLALLHAVHVHRRRHPADPAPPPLVPRAPAPSLIVVAVQVQDFVDVPVHPLADEALLGKLQTE